MAEECESATETCTYETCERGVSETKRCYWHREEFGKDPLGDGSPVDSIPDDLQGAYLREANLADAKFGGNMFTGEEGTDLTDAVLRDANLTNADLQVTDLTDAILRGADLIGATLWRADLSKVNLYSADLTDASLWDASLTDAFLGGANVIDANLKRTDLTDAHLTSADFTDANLDGANLTDADLRGTVLTGSDLRRATLSNLSLDRETTITSLREPTGEAQTDQQDSPETDASDGETEDQEPDPNEWDETARAYHDLKQQFADNSLYGQARRLHIRERRARRLETKSEDGRLNLTYLSATMFEYMTGYGVSVPRLAVWMGLLFVISTATYAATGVSRPIHYSVVTFTTAPPRSPPPGFVQLVADIETFLGTLLLITLGFVLSNREQF